MTHDRRLAVGAAVLAGAMLAIYLGLIIAEGGNSLASVLPWASLMGAGCVTLIIASWIREDTTARTLLNAGAVAYAVLGIVSILSIGIGFIAVAALSATAASRLN